MWGVCVHGKGTGKVVISLHGDNLLLSVKVTDSQIEAIILELVQSRGTGKSICPSEAARVIDGSHWRTLMPAVREVAAIMAEEGIIAVTQRGQAVDARSARGPIRLAVKACQ